MRIIPLDDSVFKNLTAKTEKRKVKQVKIPSMGNQGHPKIASNIVAEVRWLAEHSFQSSVILRLYPTLNANTISGIISRTTRIHIEPAPPEWIKADLVPPALKKPDNFA